ncbi:hypothetical protein RJ641_018718, partial [Dillenia turbinata]
MKNFRQATENFSPTRHIGKGSHGSIYKVALRDGIVVAIKRPSPATTPKSLKMKLSYYIFYLTQPAGTIGYLDPSYTSPGTKNDVYSFGVLLLEIISCRRAIDVLQTPASIIEWAMSLIQLDQM